MIVGKHLPDPWALAPEWDDQTMLERTAACIMWLNIHNFLPDAPVALARTRVRAWADRSATLAENAHEA